MIKQALAVPVIFGGEEPAGWLPAGAARPLPTPQVRVLLDIVVDGDDAAGYTLTWDGPAPEYSGDQWYARLEDAEAAAAEYFGVTAHDWRASG